MQRTPAHVVPQAHRGPSGMRDTAPLLCVTGLECYSSKNSSFRFLRKFFSVFYGIIK